jgi:hypothetical protein
MSGTVGQSRIRNDIRQTIHDRTAFEQIPGFLAERGQRIRHENIAQPFDRARTTNVETLFDFYRVLKKVLEFATEVDGTSYPINFSLEYPPTEAELPCFTTRLISRRPLSLKGVKEMSPRFMQETPDPDYPGEMVQEYLVRRYNTIEVTVWAKTNKVAQEMVEWLEDIYWQYLWALQWCGVSHPVEWLDRGSDRYEQIREQQMYGAPTTFGVITGKITKKRVTTIRKLAFSLGLLIENRPEGL